MSELRVPTVALAAEVRCGDGRVFTGRIFVPAAASHHAGPMRPEEWINEPATFFPFLPDQEEAPVLLNKKEIVAITLTAPPSEDELPPAEDGARQVMIECSALRFEGELRIDMPEGQRRVLDTVNRPEHFLTVRAGDRHHLVHKRHITRVLEKRGV
jgi:hypothetical protein